jgi:hypothetical protein
VNQKSTPLNIATLRIAGDDVALDNVIRKLNLQVTWRAKAGDPRKRGGVHATSCLNAPIADADNPGAMLHQIRTFLTACVQHGPTVFPNGVDAELSIGIAVGDSIQYVASVDISPDDIRDLATVGIALSFTAYPTSDEANDSTTLK